MYIQCLEFFDRDTSNHPFKDAFNGLIFIKHLQQTVCFTTFILTL